MEGEKAEALFKMAVYNEIKKQEIEETKISMSVKNQVLCDETAMIGVIKQTVKATGEIQEINHEFTREQSLI